jgi:hypothetical protein
MAGEVFYSVYAMDWTAGDSDLNRGLDEYYSVAIAITRRASFAPYDDHGEELYIQAYESMEHQIRRIIKLIHQSYAVMTTANNLIDTTHFKLFEPLRFQSADAYPSYVGGEWFLAGDTNDSFAGLVQQVNFSGARRKQRTDDMDI